MPALAVSTGLAFLVAGLAVSKSIDVNLKSRRKKGGIRMLAFLRCEDMMMIVSFEVSLT